jgi:hypothetical protein
LKPEEREMQICNQMRKEIFSPFKQNKLIDKYIVYGDQYEKKV